MKKIEYVLVATFCSSFVFANIDAPNLDNRNTDKEELNKIEVLDKDNIQTKTSYGYFKIGGNPFLQHVGMV